MSKKHIAEVEIKFEQDELSNLDKFVSIIRDKTSESLVAKTVNDIYGVTPSKMTWEEKINLSSEIENEKIVIQSGLTIKAEGIDKALNYQSPELSDMLKVSAILEIMGFERLSKQMRKRYGEMLVETLLGGLRQVEYAKNIISEDRRKARKGKTNRHHAIALKIASDTWVKYPNDGKMCQ